MKLLLVLPLVVISFFNSKSIEKIQVDAYSEVLNSEVIPSEYLWASSILFNNIHEDEKTVFLKKLNNQLIIDVLESNGPRTSLLHFSLYFQDENLLLAYLLNQPDPELRNEAYTKFYDNLESEGNLKVLNKNIVQEELVLFDDHKLSAYPFAAFLLNHYYSAVRVVNKKYFENILGNFDELDAESKL